MSNKLGFLSVSTVSLYNTLEGQLGALRGAHGKYQERVKVKNSPQMTRFHCFVDEGLSFRNLKFG